MLARINGGNDGVVKYLVDGIKNGRDFTRDELDQRIVLDGDLDLTDRVINSIPNNGQERYLHITLSFQENEVSEDLLKEITEEYKSLLMSSHDSDEFNFYAEAHIPKVKHIENQKTGELIERKPHIHIVIPNKNLLTGRNLNSVGLVEQNIKELDAIQEHINLKYNLESPKNHLRVQGGDRAKIISREKADIYKERKGEIKADIYSELEKRNIRNDNDFSKMLKEYGEVKIYKEGKDDRYFAVKLEGDKRFTRLKSRAFSKEYIEKRSLAEPIKNVKEINRLVENWKNVTSKQIKYINPSSKHKRVAYALLNKEGKKNFIKEEEDKYYERYKDSEGYLRRRESNKQPDIKELERGGVTTAPSAERLSFLRSRSLVYGVRGRGEGGNESKSILRSNEVNNLAEKEQERQHFNSELRLLSKSRITEFEQKSNPIAQMTKEYKLDKEELSRINLIKKKIDPERFISHCVINYFLDPGSHKISKGKDGSPRFSDGKRNWNALDFLTRTVNLKLDEAVEELKSIYQKQMNSSPFVRVEIKKRFSSEDRNERNKSLKNHSARLRTLYRNDQKDVYAAYQKNLSNIFEDRSTTYNEKMVLKSFYIAQRMAKKEEVKKKFTEGLRSIRAYHFNYDVTKKKEYETMFNEIANKFKSEENSIEGHSPYLTFDELMKDKRREFDLEEKVTKKQIASLSDLAIIKNTKKGTVDFVDPTTKKTIFTDQGSALRYKGSEDKDATLAMLEYAHEKFGGKLTLKGSREFKEACVEVLAKSDMKVILKPNKYHDLLVAKKAELTAAKELPKETIKPKTAYEANIAEIKALNARSKEADPESLAQLVEERNDKIAAVVYNLVKEDLPNKDTTLDLIDETTNVVKDSIEKEYTDARENWLQDQTLEPPKEEEFDLISRDSFDDIKERVKDLAEKDQSKDLQIDNNQRNIITSRVATELQRNGIERDEVDLNKLANEAVHKYNKFIEKGSFKIDKESQSISVNSKKIKFPENLATTKGIINYAGYDFVLDDLNRKIELEKSNEIGRDSEYPKQENQQNKQNQNQDPRNEGYQYTDADINNDWDLDR